ncbi:undecaprenyldiphospho-muramoylpentapeptide beta-N-acetylglucosaminyltransferase [Staphylococcus massiliensis]|uniref:UDP-N-acetylglucosamine--N-acetylmuramyl-(pentapeptide) pyrophosphoryl-undecaprenol N-acetylglucosamine transferase n=1 Tax=Staphylococcus massiliensis S46 TaxID=1229783 RepID=K9AJP4_9STAP|nr:undecaprenyldiphospho-muramoylpentapeptide beta-N-acetylglucosaminyltransferase [Staphylococcus massiliensis]EKU47499.1 undecaprenyldiphospho-muramoylpentapeptide beta-N- acetylglucosaminyltransferase [Staphylococcus massiliensis S46]MCG3398858.1 undecaprenyldiphospho-muramoylpentapeptide beta-N-acetylglucosaminyltransferase [Staphylococcus massiliensis]MCG3401138.1 undecaprenyldiphospho-muramoylpentapeptide beta-N-acetylglucosaminyltransferase [Staphylococcus massiliensis]MCG3412274.1 undec
MAKIAFTGGGTIGHVSVNLSLIPVAEEKGHEVFYIGSKTGIEKEMLQDKLPQVKYMPISSGKLRRYLSFENLKDVFKVLKGVLDARRILKKEKPDILFSKGGFVSVPVVIAAKSLNIPTIVHESDLTPGLANKIALKFAKKMYTTFEDTVKHLPQDKAEFIGATVRDDLKTGSRQKGYDLTNFNADKEVLLVMGGSLGSKKINDAIRNNLSTLLDKYQIIHLTGKGMKDDSISQKGYVQYEFVTDELTDLLAITDKVVSRAGSNSIYEFLVLRIPMLLIPLGLDQSRGDQIDNAKNFVKKGYAKMLNESDLNEDSLNNALTVLEQEHEAIVEQMQTFKESYTKEDLFNKIMKDALE